MDGFPNSRTSSSTRTVGQLPASESTRRRRISGLNSRFDRMLWEASLTARTCKSLPRRHKHACSSSSSSISHHCLATEGTQSHDTMPRIGAGLSPIPNNGDQAIAEFCPSVPLPNWLDNTLATLPPSHPVRRLVSPLDRHIGKELIDQIPSISAESAVFAFEAPPYESYPLSRAESDGHSGATVAVTVPKPLILNSDSQTGTSDFHGNPFEVTHNESVEYRVNTLAGLRTDPFSTPGPGCAIFRAPVARCPWGSNSDLTHTTDDVSQEAMDIPPPFSTPGPFVSPRPVSFHVFGNHSVTTRMVPDEVYPTIPKSTRDGCRQLSALPHLVPGLTSDNYLEGLSSSTLATEPTSPGDRGVITPSPDLNWFSPMELTRRSGVNGNIVYDDASTLISDDLLRQERPFGALSLFSFPISSKYEAESLPGLRRHMAASDTFPRTPMSPPPPQSMLLRSFPTYCDRVFPDPQSPESSEGTDKLDIVDMNAYTPAAVVSGPVRGTSGIFAPTPGILLSPLLDTASRQGTLEG